MNRTLLILYYVQMNSVVCRINQVPNGIRSRSLKFLESELFTTHYSINVAAKATISFNSSVV